MTIRKPFVYAHAERDEEELLNGMDVTKGFLQLDKRPPIRVAEKAIAAPFGRFKSSCTRSNVLIPFLDLLDGLDIRRFPSGRTAAPFHFGPSDPSDLTSVYSSARRAEMEIDMKRPKTGLLD